jgi:hypothetical protein
MFVPYPAYPGPYAVQADLAAYWRVLSVAEQTRVSVLLGAVADRINELPGAQNFNNSACHWVSLDAVKRVMLVSGDGERTESQSMAGMSVDRTFVNPAGSLYISSREMNRLRGRVGQSAGSVVMSSHVRVPREPWNFQRSFQTSRVQWMRLIPDQVSLSVGAERHLMVLAATFYEYEERTDYALFTTSDPSIATVANDGLVTAKNAGTATITATYEGFTDTSTVTVS